MKKNNVFWGIILILLAVILVMDASGVSIPLEGSFGEVSILALIGGVLLLAFAISRIVNGKFHEIFFPLAFLVMLFEDNIATYLGREDPNLISNWILILCALLLTIGFSILIPQGGKNFTFNIGGKCGGSSTVYVDSITFVTENVENNMGACTVHFENADRYTGGGVLNVENNMGSVTVCVPKGWHVVSKIDTNMANTSIPSSGDPNGPTVTITGENNMGSLRVEFV